MSLNFNNIRARACHAYDSLADKLNTAIQEHEARSSEKGILTIKCEEIQEEMNNLKEFIGIIAMAYEPGDPDFKPVFEEIYPDDKSMIDFNPDN